MVFLVTCGKLHHFHFPFYIMGIMILRTFVKLFQVLLKMIKQLIGMAPGCYLYVQILLAVTWEHRRQYKSGCLESSALVLSLVDKHVM